MARLLQLCSKEAETAPQMWNGQTASDLVSHVIEYVEWWLKNGRLDAAALEVVARTKSGASTPGLTSVLRHLASVQPLSA